MVVLSMGVQEAERVGQAREDFAAGAEVLDGVRPDIARSWLRCRDRFGVDPSLGLAPLADDQSSCCLDHHVLIADLGGLAAVLHQRISTGLVTVVDARGKLLASWGTGVAEAEDVHLAPWYAWSEAASGTNGMGTALESGSLTSVRGPEHWCSGFTGLDCLAAPVIDPHSGVPVGAVNVSAPTGAMSSEVPALLGSAVASVRQRLVVRAGARGGDLIAAYDARRQRRHVEFVVDTAGRIVAADDEVSRLLGVTAGGRYARPDRRPHVRDPRFATIVQRASTHAHDRREWRCPARLAVPWRAEPIELLLTAVMHGGHPIGFVVTVGAPSQRVAADGEALAAGAPARVVARQGDRSLLLRPEEIRLAEVDGNTVWLYTDRGRVRAAERGLGTLEKALSAGQFLRVHRRFLVNLTRVDEAVHARGGLMLRVGRDCSIEVPVSRSRTPAVRARLGL